MQKKADLIWHTLSYGLLFLPDIRFFCHGQLLFFGHIQMERIIGTLHQTMTQSATHFTRFRRRLIGKEKIRHIHATANIPVTIR